MLRTSILICGLLAVGAAGMPAARAKVVLEWNEIMVATTAAQNPFAQGRSAAITQLAVFEAVNAVTGEYEPYLGTVEAPSGASAKQLRSPPRTASSCTTSRPMRPRSTCSAHSRSAPSPTGQRRTAVSRSAQRPPRQ